MLKFDADAVLQPGVQNRTLQRFAHLNRSRTYRERSGQFAMEGYRLVLDAAESGVRLNTLILTESAACHYGDAFAPYLKGVQTLLIADGLAKTISDTETAQGVFAVAQMPREMQTLPQQGHRCMLLHCLQDPSNLGAILRTAEALGTDGVYLYHCCDLYNPKAIRSSMGALFRIPFSRITDISLFLTHCQEHSLPTCAAVVDRDALPLKQYDFSDGAVVCIGNEGNGLPAEFVSECTQKLTIPMAPAANSLNAAMAAGLFLWEMSRFH
ncbi:MAG: RNA methyltransferase [Oscillospiraceae bacterium]|nr:RNA methyltransferase [Oscillospiraceae bacterium]